MSFRVQELQQLMSMCSRSRVGRKQELLSRALYLVKNSADGPKVCKVAQAIRDLYNRRYPARQIVLNGSESAANQGMLQSYSPQFKVRRSLIRGTLNSSTLHFLHFLHFIFEKGCFTSQHTRIQ